MKIVIKMSIFKCENKECGHVFRNKNPEYCRKCNSLEFSSHNIKSNNKLIVIGLLILLIGTGFILLKNKINITSYTNSKEKITKVDNLKKELEGLENKSNTNNHIKIGQKLYGGIVFYIDETEQRGLVAALNDIPNSHTWGCKNEDYADGTRIGTGHQNTIDVGLGCSEIPTAASEVLVFESQGYNDWYLPSKNELEEMFKTLGNDKYLRNIAGFRNDKYWSSSQYNDKFSWGVSFLSGGTHYYSKDFTFKVRPIRSFNKKSS